MRHYLTIFALITVCSCRTDIIDHPAENTMAYVPVYAPVDEPGPVELKPPKPIDNAGKIYVYGNYIFQNEQYEGIHIIDNNDPSKPVKQAFLSIPFNTEMAIRAGYLYANSVHDLLVIDLRNPAQPKVINRLKNAFPLIAQDFPPMSGNFVCPDPDKGVIIDWKLQMVEKAACRR